MAASPGRITFAATITDIRLQSRNGTAARWQIALDRTLFSPASATGTLIAVSPNGTRLEVPVRGVLEEDDTLWHIVDKPLTEGTEITGVLTPDFA